MSVRSLVVLTFSVSAHVWYLSCCCPVTPYILDRRTHSPLKRTGPCLFPDFCSLLPFLGALCSLHTIHDFVYHSWVGLLLSHVFFEIMDSSKQMLLAPSCHKVRMLIVWYDILHFTSHHKSLALGPIHKQWPHRNPCNFLLIAQTEFVLQVVSILTVDCPEVSLLLVLWSVTTKGNPLDSHSHKGQRPIGEEAYKILYPLGTRPTPSGGMAINQSEERDPSNITLYG